MMTVVYVCVWQSSRSKQQTMFVPAKLTVVGVFNQLRDIASMSGNAVSAVCVVTLTIFDIAVVLSLYMHFRHCLECIM